MPADEAQRRAAAVKELLREIGSGASDETTWWNHEYDELGGRTPTQAWLAGDTEMVTALIDRWYAASEAAAERTASDPAFLDHLRKQIARLDERVAHRRLPTAG